MTVSFRGAAKPRTADAFANAAKIIGCDVPAVQAVVEIEAAGKGYDAKGRPKMLFEPHVFYRCLSGAKRKEAVEAGLAYPKWKKGYPRDSYPRLMHAIEIDETAALKAASWGLPQILGENYKAAGYSSPQAMVEDFVEGEDEQIAAMANFIVANKLAFFLKTHNWAKFARGYNGPGYAANNYHTKLEKAHERHAKAHLEDIEEEAEPLADAPETPQEGQPEEIPTPPDGDPEVFLVQRRLAQMKYYPGMLDGKWGGKTAGAIAGFKNDRGLKGAPKIDAALKAELVKAEAEGFTRPIADARAYATATDLSGNKTIKQTWWARFWAKMQAAWAAVIAGFWALIAKLSDNDFVRPIAEAVSAIPDWAWIATALTVSGVIAALVWRSTRHAEQATIDDYREGKLV